MFKYLIFTVLMTLGIVQSSLKCHKGGITNLCCDNDGYGPNCESKEASYWTDGRSRAGHKRFDNYTFVDTSQ